MDNWSDGDRCCLPAQDLSLIHISCIITVIAFVQNKNRIFLSGNSIRAHLFQYAFGQIHDISLEFPYKIFSFLTFFCF